MRHTATGQADPLHTRTVEQAKFNNMRRDGGKHGMQILVCILILTTGKQAAYDMRFGKRP